MSVNEWPLQSYGELQGPELAHRGSTPPTAPMSVGDHSAAALRELFPHRHRLSPSVQAWCAPCYWLETDGVSPVTWLSIDSSKVSELPKCSRYNLSSSWWHIWRAVINQDLRSKCKFIDPSAPPTGPKSGRIVILLNYYNWMRAFCPQFSLNTQVARLMQAAWSFILGPQIWKDIQRHLNKLHQLKQMAVNHHYYSFAPCQGPAQRTHPIPTTVPQTKQIIIFSKLSNIYKVWEAGQLSAQAGQVTGRNDIWTPAFLTPTYCPWILEQINNRNVGNWWFLGPQYLNSSVNFNNIKVTWTDIIASQYDAIGSAQHSDKVLLPKKKKGLNLIET